MIKSNNKNILKCDICERLFTHKIELKSTKIKFMTKSGQLRSTNATCIAKNTVKKEDLNNI